MGISTDIPASRQSSRAVRVGDRFRGLKFDRSALGVFHPRSLAPMLGLTALLLLAGGLHTSPAFAGEQASPALVQVPEQPCLQVRGSRVLAGELARQEPRFGALAPDFDFGYSPDAGKLRWIALPDRGDSRAADAADGTVATTVAATAETRDPPHGKPAENSRLASKSGVVCITRWQRPLSGAMLMEALELDGLGTVEAEVLSWHEGAFPDGVIRMPLRGIVPPARGANEVMWRGTLEFEQGRSMAVWARVRLEREEQCARLRRAVRRGEPLLDKDVEYIRCDAAAIVNRASLAVPPAEHGHEQGLSVRTSSQQAPLTARDLSAGLWLLPEHLTVAPILRKGDPASLTVVSGGVALALPVVAEQAGGVGESIWVRSVSDRKRLKAVVAGPESVRLESGVMPSRMK